MPRNGQCAITGIGETAYVRPNFHTLGLILSGNPRKTAGVDRLDKIVVLNLEIFEPHDWLKTLT